MEAKLNGNLVFLSCAVFVLLISLFLGNWLFPMDGQFFQVIAVAFGSMITLLGQSIKSVFHIPDATPPTVQTPPPIEPKS